MNQKFYMAIENNSERKTIYLIITKEKNDCLYLTEAGYIPIWRQCRDVFKELPFFEISKRTYFKLKNLKEWERYQINKLIYYSDLFKYWGVYEELCEVLI